jgi:RNA-directed DNA polymerase
LFIVLRAGIQEQDPEIPCKQGVPQGGPLSPLLSNIVLDKLDKELERRGHRFVRYAGDCSIYVKSKRIGERVMESISTYIEKGIETQSERREEHSNPALAHKIIRLHLLSQKRF